jgi:putative transposase
MRPEQYRWSSHRANAGTETDALVIPHPTYLALGDTEAKQQAAYRAMFESRLEPETEKAIRG